MDPMHIKSEDPTAVFLRLNEKFAANFTTQMASPSADLSKIELFARGVSAIGVIQQGNPACTATQKEISTIFDEIFADLTTSVYLAACALDKPAQMVLRRALELGVAIAFLWEQPQTFWGWKQCDQDLVFTDMLEQLRSESVRSFFAALNPAILDNPLFDFSEARALYRALSNTVHGKIAQFESQLQNRFSASESDWRSHLSQVGRVEALLYQLWFNAFPDLRVKLQAAMPQLARLI